MPKKIQRFSSVDTKEETHTQQKSLSYSEIVGNLTDDQTVSLHKQLQEFRDYLLKKSLESENKKKRSFHLTDIILVHLYRKIIQVILLSNNTRDRKQFKERERCKTLLTKMN
ncbi:hypothetical protein [Enterococcus hirae]|uniref:hypothetical protein n=1 Tax=Enterococcus hirae TaxID=1354 RepID=UPI001F05DB76|nr:hypothetical protein [Enterococcus hirae]MCH1649304.1 hypothetical protein [Enterococcus hirae]